MVHLYLLSQASTVSNCLLPDGTYSLGRKADNHLIVAHPTVSEYHCELLVNGGEVIVRDNNSRNGTFVGESEVRGQRGIGHGQRLRVGSVEFRIQVDSPDDTDSADPSSTHAFQRWLRSAGQSGFDPPRFPVFFAPDASSDVPHHDACSGPVITPSKAPDPGIPPASRPSPKSSPTPRRSPAGLVRPPDLRRMNSQDTSADRDPLSRALKHIAHLAETIGPRPSTGAAERTAHEYVRSCLQGLGCDVRIDDFFAARSAYRPYLLGFGSLLGVWAGVWLGDSRGWMVFLAVAAYVLVASLLLEMSGVANPLRWVAGGESSRNVIGITRARGAPRRRIAVLAHVDSHRAPWIWRSRGRFRLYLGLSMLGCLAAFCLPIFLVLTAVLSPEPWRTCALVAASIVGLLVVLLLEAETSPFSPGANDNASGVGVMLSLAAELQRSPLPATEVWWVATGCEEVGAYGGADFCRRYREQFAGGLLLAVDTVGGKATYPTVLTFERLLFHLRYPSSALAWARRVAARRPQLGTRFQGMAGGYSDLFHPLKAGLPCLAVIGTTSDGWMPHWHQSSDVLARIDPESLDRALAFISDLLRVVDSEPSREETGGRGRNGP